ncbi:MAG: TerB family tellurite resistance protein [Acidobacteriota bacterium]|jgi:uncharacterized tellurite resistance protein B-like protein
MSILNFLGLGENAPQGGGAGDTETVRKIVDQLDGLEPERARYVAAFAYVLSRVAHADLKISKEETRSMERILMAMGNLPEEQAILVVQMAKTQALLFAGTENFLVTRELETLATREQKLKILQCLFAVSASDESISGAEETEIRKIADELKIARKDYLEVKLTYREYLSVLKHSPET